MAELTITNVTISSNIVPWKSKITKQFPSYQGVKRGRSVPYSTVYNVPPQASFYTGEYYYQYYIYKENVDKLVGFIGGTIFLMFVICSTFAFFVNTTLYRKAAAE